MDGAGHGQWNGDPVTIETLGIGDAVLADAQTRIESFPQNANWASSIGDPCLRYLVYCRTRQDEKKRHGPDLQLVFDEGKSHERLVIAQVKGLGYDLITQDQQALRVRWPEYDITGRIDGMLALDGERLPVEIKSMSGWTYDALVKATDPVAEMLTGSRYMRRYPAQLLLYLLMSRHGKGAERGVWIWKNKQTGAIADRVVRLYDYLDYAESLLVKAGAINEHIKAGTEPDRIGDWEMCGRCDFSDTCYPDKTAEDRLALIEGLEPILDEIQTVSGEMKPTEKRIEALKRERDRRIAHVTEGQIVVAGAWQGKRGKRWSWKRLTDGE